MAILFVSLQIVMGKFILTSDYQPTGDQPEAIRQLTEGLERGDKSQVLLGVTGSGKDFYDGKRHRKPQPPYPHSES